MVGRGYCGLRCYCAQDTTVPATNTQRGGRQRSKTGHCFLCMWQPLVSAQLLDTTVMAKRQLPALQALQDKLGYVQSRCRHFVSPQPAEQQRPRLTAWISEVSRSNWPFQCLFCSFIPWPRCSEQSLPPPSPTPAESIVQQDLERQHVPNSQGTAQLAGNNRLCAHLQPDLPLGSGHCVPFFLPQPLGRVSELRGSAQGAPLLCMCAADMKCVSQHRTRA